MDRRNVAKICLDCEHVGGWSPSESTLCEALVAWHLLKAATVTSQRCCDAPFDETPWRLLVNLISAFLRLGAAAMPWRGGDLCRGAFCEATERPVYDDDSSHGAINVFRVLLQSLINNLKRGVPVECTLCPCQSCSWEPVLLRSLIELIERANETTELDEIGFGILANLCLTLRPREATHIDETTRVEYLLQGKLQRQQLLHGARCPSCFHLPTCCACSYRTASAASVLHPSKPIIVLSSSSTATREEPMRKVCHSMR